MRETFATQPAPPETAGALRGVTTLAAADFAQAWSRLGFVRWLRGILLGFDATTLTLVRVHLPERSGMGAGLLGVVITVALMAFLGAWHFASIEP